jgi:Tfp pilus assembly protein PilE
MVELLITVAIVVILASISFGSFLSYKKERALIEDRALVSEVLREARNLTLVSKNGLAYGVHFSSNDVTLYGGTYSSTDTSNKQSSLSTDVKLLAILPGGGSEIQFSRLTGETNQSSTATIELNVPSIGTSTIKIYKTGIVELVK